jgi:hypothetical protein
MTNAKMDKVTAGTLFVYDPSHVATVDNSGVNTAASKPAGNNNSINHATRGAFFQ